MRERRHHKTRLAFAAVSAMLLMTTPRPVCAGVEGPFTQDLSGGMVALAGTPVEARVLRAIRHASQTTGVALPYLLAKAYRESGFNVHADAAASSAAGIFQFTRQTWLELFRRYGATYGYGDLVPLIRRTSRGYLKIPKTDDGKLILNLRHDPVLSSQLAAEYTRENTMLLRRNLKRAVTPEELYVAHFMGAKGAVQLLRAAELRPTVTAASLFPEAAASNPRLFYSYPGRVALTVSALRRRLVRSFRRELKRFSGPASKFAGTVAPRMATAPMQSVPRKPLEQLDHHPRSWTRAEVDAAVRKGLSPHGGLVLPLLHGALDGRDPVRPAAEPNGELAQMVVRQALAAQIAYQANDNAPDLAPSGWRVKTPTVDKVLIAVPEAMAKAALIHAHKAYVRVSADRVSGAIPAQRHPARVASGVMPRYEEDRILKPMAAVAEITVSQRRPDV